MLLAAEMVALHHHPQVGGESGVVARCLLNAGTTPALQPSPGTGHAGKADAPLQGSPHTSLTIFLFFSESPFAFCRLYSNMGTSSYLSRNARKDAADSSSVP
jgi:hypothetical protein